MISYEHGMQEWRNELQILFSNDKTMHVKQTDVSMVTKNALKYRQRKINLWHIRKPIGMKCRRYSDLNFMLHRLSQLWATADKIILTSQY
jgi:hypothetical protein